MALAAGGLVPPLLEPLMAAAAAAGGGPGASGRSAAVSSSAPILRAKLLDIISIMYQHHPRPKEFIMKYRIQVGVFGGGGASAHGKQQRAGRSRTVSRNEQRQGGLTSSILGDQDLEQGVRLSVVLVSQHSLISK